DLVEILEKAFAKFRDGHPEYWQVVLAADVFLGCGDARLHILAALGGDDERADLLVHGAAEEWLAGSERHSHCHRAEGLARRALATEKDQAGGGEKPVDQLGPRRYRCATITDHSWGKGNLIALRSPVVPW